jgi:hypothetical protein
MSDRPSRRRVLAALGAGVTAGLAGCSGSDPGGDQEDPATDTEGEPEEAPESTTDEAESTTDGGDSTDDTEDGGTSGRTIPGEVSNDLTGLEVVDHEAAVGEDGFSGAVTVRNVGDETATLVDHALDFVLYDADDSVVTSVGTWGTETREPAPGEESVMEFVDGPMNDDTDFTVVESYVVELTCSVADPGVYCP